MNEATAPRRAATIMVLREASNGIEVLMTRRHASLAFMGGMWVFPGGALSAADYSAETLARISDESKAQCARLKNVQGHALPKEECLGLAVAACRETFEEAGVLLTVDQDDTQHQLEKLARLQSERTLIAARPENFSTMLERERVMLDVGRLVYWAHWITPSTAPRRFDTHFFAVAVGPDQAIAADTTETVECTWMSPSDLLAASARGDMPMSQPTLYNLFDLRDSYGRHGSLQKMLANEANRAVVPILPKMLIDEEHNTIIMPWDEDYARAAGEGVPASIVYPAPLRGWPSRMTVNRRMQLSSSWSEKT